MLNGSNVSTLSGSSKIASVLNKRSAGQSKPRLPPEVGHHLGPIRLYRTNTERTSTIMMT